ncbi:MAG: tRNA (N6-isopentenyl adenosine(37)-C2)-methylthiotransferase MiaB [Candidatus Adiutrix sp.]|jgi:tRNA-2-methylthio-N6-dimethylallyladenosine synthase|nr:tRNA (N6-isopentenyl adenosine(37)-C2)-methylthiotransferase MiaB [Candidatus Adiutrix sp.]
MTEARQACLITFGCQMNEYDSGRLGELLSARGWTLTSDRAAADFIFFNTCSIREKAARRVLNHLEQVRPLKKGKPGLIIAVGGCLAEQEGRTLLERAPWLDLVAGPQHLPEIPEILDRMMAGERAGLSLTGAGHRPAWSRENLSALGGPELPRPPAAAGAARRLTASVTIMQGCDNYCAYCVVPYLRGPEMSRPADDILDEAKALLEAGVADLTLLGQNVNSYGRGLAGAPSFPELLVRVAGLGAPRLRFTTSHPKDFTPELIGLFGSLPALCESLHLPVQSGSDRILKAMGRIYDRESYLRLVADLRRARPDLALSTDVIVGFPGESEADFEATLSLVELVGYDSMFSFKYSDRPRTKAADMPGKLPEEEKGRRLSLLQARQKAVTLAKNAAHAGQTLEVLVERISGRRQGQLTGRARNYKLVHFDGPPELIGRTVPVLITEGWAASLRGRLAEA